MSILIELLDDETDGKERDHEQVMPEPSARRCNNTATCATFTLLTITPQFGTTFWRGTLL